MKAERPAKSKIVKESTKLPRRSNKLKAGDTKFKKSAAAVKESEIRFRNIIESSKDGIIFFDGKTRKIILGNRTMAKLLGCSKKALVGRSISSLHPPEEWTSIEKRFKKHLRGELTVSTGIPLLRNDGSILHMDIFSSLTMLEGRTCFSAFFRDVTERKQVEEALRESETRYRSLFENSDDAILLTAPDGRILQANPSACRMFGRTEAEIIQVGRNGVVDQTDPRLPDVLEERKRTGRSRGELRYKRQDGQLFPGEVTSVVFQTKDGLRTCMIIRDVTERKRAEDALRESEENYRNLVERANDGIGIGQDGIMHFANARLADMIGYSIEEIVDMPFIDFFMPEEVPKVMDFYKRRMDRENLPTIYETALRHKDGRKIDIEVNTGIINYKGKPADLVLSRDITRRKQVLETLRESETRLRAQYQGSPTPTFTWQKKGETFELTDFNLAAQVATQMEAKKYLRKTAAEMYQDRQEILQDIHRCFTEKKVIKRELQSQHFIPGRTMIATYAFVPPDLVMVHAEDITERKQMEEALRESEEKFRNMFDNSSIGMSMTSIDGSVYVNQAFCEMLGYTKEELSGLKWQDITHPDDIDLTQEHLEQLLSGEETSVRFMKRYLTKDGSTLWGDLNVVLQKDKNGNPLYYISAFLDISERKRWEALIERVLRETRVRYEVSQALAGKETEDEVLDALIQQANLYPQALISIVTFERMDTELVGILCRIDSFSSGLTAMVSKGTRFSPSEFPTINRYLVDQLFVSEDVFSDERVDSSTRELIRQAGGTSFAGFRLTVGNELLGLIYAEAKPRGYFDKDKQHLYLTLAEQGAVALRAARLREQIRESQKRFQDLVETLSDWIWEVNQDGVYTYVSPKIRDLLGFEPEELLGKTPFDLMPPEEARRVSSLFEPLRAARQPLVTLEKTCHHKDGHLVVFETSGLPFFNGEGQFKGYRGVDRDITARKKAEEALRLSEEKYRKLLDSASDAILIADIEGNFLEINKKAEELLGYTQEEFQTMNFSQIHPKEELEKVSYAFRKIMEGDLNSLNDTKVMRKDGRLIPVDITGNSIEFFGRKLIQGIFRDITERKRAEEALRLAEEKYRAIVENAVEGIFQSTSDGKFLMVNTAVAKFYGYDSPEELITAISNIGEQLYVYPEDRQRYRRLLADEGVVKGFENQFYRKDGTIKWGSMNVRSVKDKEGHILHYEGTIEDITARKEAEEGLQNSLDKLRKAMGGIIQAMALTVETRDPYTAGHQRRVADLARAIAQEMGLPEDQVDALRMAGNVHDLGKISIPAEILSKPAQLSDIEFSLIKAHPQISYDILKDIDFNWPVAQIVLQHHERINGSGYPNGLSGKAIYLEARILAVADVVEAISSHRPYRPAFGIDVALEEISKNKDVLYDPEAVEACLRLFREKGFKFE